MAGAVQFSSGDYTLYHAKAVKGLPFGVEHGTEDITTISTVPIEWGQAVAYAGDDNNTGRPLVKLPTSAADIIVGVCLLRHRTPQVFGDPNYFTDPTDSIYTNFPAKYPIPTRKVGKLYVYSETPVDRGSAVHVRFAPGAGVLPLGNFRATAVAGETLPLTSARWFEKTEAPGLAIIDLGILG